jgi:hypothetical protein
VGPSEQRRVTAALGPAAPSGPQAPATRTCPHCREEIPYDATTCKYCGQHSVDEQTKRRAERSKRRKSLGCVTAIVAVVAAIAVGTVVCPEKPEQRAQREKEEAGYAARSAAETLVSKYLRSPSTASFSDETILRTEGYFYLVHLAVDAQNAFGATIRGYYCVVVSFDKDDPLGAQGYHYNADYAVQECPPEPDALTILAVMGLNHWPAPTPAPRAGEAEPPAAQSSSRAAPRGPSPVPARDSAPAAAPERTGTSRDGSGSRARRDVAPLDAGRTNVDAAVTTTEVIRLRVTTQPVNAEIRVHGARVDNPYEGRFGRGGPDVRVEVSARGYDGDMRWISLDADQDVRVVLVRSASGGQREEPGAADVVSPGPPTPPSTASPPAAAGRPGIDTNNPFAQ